MFKAIAKMADETHAWTVTIINNCTTFADAERAARRFAKKYDNCLWVQVLNA